MVLLGLHFDEAQGLFMQQPLLLVGALGLHALWRRDRRLGILLAAVYLSVVLPNSMHVNWYGGISMIGRFAWPAVLLWVFPIACAIEAAGKPERMWTTLFAFCIALQVLFATRWLTVDSLLIARGELPPWAPTGVQGDLLPPAVWLRLPSFKDFDAYLRHPANWVAVAVALLLAVTGWQTRYPSRAAWLVSLGVAVAVVAAVPPPLNPWSIAASGLPGLVGQVDGGGRTAIEGRDGEGFLTFGPYAPLAPGRYAATLRYESDGGDALRAAEWQMVLGSYATTKTPIGGGNLPASSTNDGVLSTQLIVPERRRRRNMFQFRVRYPGSGSLSVRSLTLTPLAIGTARDDGPKDN
jgi:hypothetical protein